MQYLSSLQQNGSLECIRRWWNSVVFACFMIKVTDNLDPPVLPISPSRDLTNMLTCLSTQRSSYRRLHHRNLWSGSVLELQFNNFNSNWACTWETRVLKLQGSHTDEMKCFVINELTTWQSRKWITSEGQTWRHWQQAT